MNDQQYIQDAIEMVSAWDIPDEDFAEAVNAQSKLMAGVSPDDVWHCSDCPKPTHR